MDWILVCLYVCLSMESTRSALETFMDNDHISQEGLLKFQYLFGRILSFVAWMKGNSFWHYLDEEAERYANGRIMELMDDIKRICPRTSGNGWKLPKFHSLKHVAHNILSLIHI